MTNTTEAKAPCPLAVMQRTESCARLYYQRPDAYGRETPVYEQARLDKEAREARAKVAELVAATSHFMSTTYPPVHDEPVGREEQDEFAAAWKRLRAALAAFSEVQP